MKKIFLLPVVFFCCIQLTRAQHAGDLDSSFGVNGIVRTSIGSVSDAPSKVKQMFLRDDGSVYVLLEANNQSFIQKRLPDGSPDLTYGFKGFSTSVNIYYAHAAMQPDGKIVVAGTFYVWFTDENIGIVRYNTDGSLDGSFSGDGKQPIGFSNLGASAASVNILSDGKIIVVIDVSSDRRFVTRYNSDGSSDGTTEIYYSQAIAFQNDGKMVFAHDRLDRSNMDGTLDSSFSDQTLSFQPFVLAIQSDGKIVVAGNQNNGLTIARYNNDGHIDSTFSDDGIQITTLTSISGFPNVVSFQDDGKVTVSITDYPNGNNVGLVRFNKDGSLDNTLSGDGELAYNSNLNLDSVHYISTAIAGNGKIAVAGSTLKEPVTGIALARYNMNGSPDNTFDEDGMLTDRLHISSTYYTSSAIQSDGKIVTAGYALIGSSYDFALARYNKDGSLDNSFSGDGKLTTGFGANNDYASSVAIQKDGKIVAGGYSVNKIQAKNISHYVLTRYNMDGSLDSTFSGDGKQVSDVDSYFAHPPALTLQSDGKIIVAATIYDSNNQTSSFIVRYNTDGSPDNTFNADAAQEIFRAPLNAVAVQQDGKVVLAAAPFGIARFNEDGSPDNTFSQQYPEFSIYNDDESVSLKALAIQEDGKIVGVGGWFNQYAGDVSHFVTVRYNTNGSLDSSFSDDGIDESFFDVANTVAIQSDGKIIAAGSSEAGNNGLYSSDFALIRYNGDGSRDNSFSHDGLQVTTAVGGYNRIFNIVISNNKLYATGSGQFSGNLGIVARYLLDDKGRAPAVNLAIPNNMVKYTALARIKLNATVVNGTITKVRFYNGTTFLHTETVSPYGFLWVNVPVGNYTFTAKATDHDGNVTTSNSINVSVVNENVPPVVSIVSPVDETTYTGPATINLIAKAKDPNDRISKVEFYNGTTLIITKHYYPYSYTWRNVQPGNYTLTAKAFDDKGLSATSDPVTVTVTTSNVLMVNSKLSISSKTDLNGVSLKLSPNPASNILQIFTGGLQQKKQSTISVISVSGVVIKTIQATSNQIMQIDVSSLRSGVYFLKVLNGDKVLYTRFVKL